MAEAGIARLRPPPMDRTGRAPGALRTGGNQSMADLLTLRRQSSLLAAPLVAGFALGGARMREVAPTNLGTQPSTPLRTTSPDPPFDPARAATITRARRSSLR